MAEQQNNRALVLAGAGSTGHAWEIGVIAGLSEAGMRVAEADLIIGTSAGSTVAAQVTSTVAPTDLYAQILAEQPVLQSPVSSDPRRERTQAAENVMRVTSDIIGAAKNPTDMRRRVGAAFLNGSAIPGNSAGSQWRATVADRLPSHEWPERRVHIVAVDATTGEPAVFDRHCGVGLVDAVAASTSNGSAYNIGDRWYINGGYRRNENADLAAGYARVLVLSPFGGRSRHPLEWHMQLSAQVDELRAGGSSVETIFPTHESEHMFGANAMDLSLRQPAARAGYDQGKVLAEQLEAFWLR